MSIFAIELETLAWRVFMDIDTSIQLQMVRDRFIDGRSVCSADIWTALNRILPCPT